jgi:hypothetical protein
VYPALGEPLWQKVLKNALLNDYNKLSTTKEKNELLTNIECMNSKIRQDKLPTNKEKNELLTNIECMNSKIRQMSGSSSGMPSMVGMANYIHLSLSGHLAF